MPNAIPCDTISLQQFVFIVMHSGCVLSSMRPKCLGKVVIKNTCGFGSPSQMVSFERGMVQMEVSVLVGPSGLV